MADGLQQLVKLQQGFEATPGTLVPATVIRGGITGLEYGPMTTLQQPPTKDGSLAMADGAVLLGEEFQINESGYVTFEDLPYLCEAGFKAVSPTADGGTPIAYTRNYVSTLTSQDSPHACSLEAGTNTEAFAAAYGFLKNLEISGGIKALTTYKASWAARAATAQAFTSALSRRALERTTPAWRLYIDSTGATMGTTLVTACVTAFNYKSGNLYEPHYCLDGTTTFAKPVQQMQAPSIDITFEIGAQTLALLGDYRAATMKYVRLENVGTQIHGTSVVNKRIRIDMSGNLMAWPLTGNNATGGVLTLQATFAGAQDNSGSFSGLQAINIVNSIITLI